MSEKLRQIFKDMPSLEPSGGLQQRIMSVFYDEKARQLRRKAFFLRFAMAMSLSSVVASVWKFGAAVWHSDFWTMASLLFSDAKVVISHWNEFIFSLLETVPVFSLIAILAPCLILILSANYYLKVENGSEIGEVKYNL